MTLGIDIGGTNVSLGLVQDGAIQNAFSAPSFPPEASLEQTLEALSAHISRIITPQTRKIGIGVPSVVDLKEGIVYDTQNIPSWKEVPLKAFLEERFQIPVAVNNDANCYALGVYAQYPETDRPELLVTITLGTGVGMGIVEEGRLFCGANCGAGEIGTLPYRDSMLEDYCGRHFFDAAGRDSKEASAAARAGDPAALAFFDELGRNLGVLMSTVLFAYDPSHVAFGGGIAHNYPLFRPAMERYLQEHFPYRKVLERLKVNIFTDHNIPVIGAALL
jgi:glucokinase